MGEKQLNSLVGVPIGSPTAKELAEILSRLPQDYRVTCCGTEAFLYVFDSEKVITIDTESELEIN